MQIIEKEEVNTGRQAFIDIAKVIAILGMICSHILLVWQHSNNFNFSLNVFF